MTAPVFGPMPGAGEQWDQWDQWDQWEQWRPVVGFEGWYAVSSLGQVRRVAPAPGSQSRPGRILHPGRDRTGRPMVNLYRVGQLFPRLVAHLVADAFLGPRPAGHVVTVRNGDQRDVSAANLAYQTRQQINDRASAPLRKLTAAEAAEIRAAATQTPRVSVRALARRYGITYQTVSRIQRGEAYHDLDNLDPATAEAATVARSERQDGSAALQAGVPRRPCRPGILHIAADDPRHPVAGCARVPLDPATLTPADAVAEQARCRRHGCLQRWPQGRDLAAHHTVRGDVA
jgi:transposase-like protein